MSFVMLAIGIRSFALCDASTSPVAAFMTRNARASGFGTAARAEPANPSATTVTRTSRRMRPEGYFTRSFCPTCSEFVLTPGLSCSICAIGTPVFAEIEPNVSPAATV